ncbi:hypothetical protein [Gemmobacter denitrificans]|uniref:Uncharacterized protein n=1 Tax=Gemmobacter denitrificans TaxID=3123040 RepID=A0ABU8BSH5_9RHOB
MTSKAAKRRARKRRVISLPGGVEIAQRPTGRDRTHTNQPAEDARKPALQARCRMAGCPTTPEQLRASTAPLRGSAVGLCIEAIHHQPEKRARLWDTWQAISAARENYRLRYLGTTGHPQAAAIAMMPDPMETDPSLRVDLRTAEERDTAAKRADHEWSRAIEALPMPQHRMAIRSAIDGFIGGDVGALWRDARPTPNGQMVVRALELLTEARNG